MVTGADSLYTLRAEDAQLEDYLPLDLREIPGEWKPESAAPQGKEPREQGNTRKIQQGQVHPQTGQIRVQPERSRPLGSGYGGEWPGQEQSLLCYPGRTQDTLLHCREDAGPAGRDYGERHCGCAVCLSAPTGQDNYLRPWS